MFDKEKYLKSKIINLVSISTKDRAIFTKLNSSDIFDPLIFYDGKNLDSLFENNTIVKLSNKNNWLKLELKLQQINNLNDFIEFINHNSIFIPKRKINLLIKSFSTYKQIILDYLKLKFEILDKKLINLDIIARNRLADSGDLSLFLARYFLVGSLSNKEVIKAPIFFKAVNINLENVSIKSDESNDLYINEKLMIHLIKQEKKSSLILKEWNEISDIESAITFLNIHFNFNFKIPKVKTHFINEDVPKVKNRSSRKINLEDTYIFGFFKPRGGKLKQDVEHIINIKSDVFDDRKKTEKLNPHEVILETTNKWIQISPLNLTQLFALNLSLRANTIIHGPPGTGKSETIANIIANIMINNKTSLMVSEKKAALDVLLSRLGPLKDFGMFFQDTKITNDKMLFYEKIRKLSNLYNVHNIIEQNFEYSENSFKNLINEKHELNNAFKILKIIKTWNIENFDYNNYLEAKFEYFNEETLSLIKIHKLNKISKINFFYLTRLSVFLLGQNKLSNDSTESFIADMRVAFINFKQCLSDLNLFWTKLTQVDLESLSILEINKIGNSQPKIDILFKKYPNLGEMFDKDIFIYENLEKSFLKLEEFCKTVNLNIDILIEMIKNNNFLKLSKAINEVSYLEKKYVISNWVLKNQIITKKFIKVKFPEWKTVILLIDKIISYNLNFSDYFIYLDNKKILNPINVFFFKKEFIFKNHLTLFIENNWFQFNWEEPIIIYENDITYEKSQLADKVFGFEEKYINSENIKLIEDYSLINNQIYKKNKLDWEVIVNEIYQKLIITWKLKIDHSENKKDIIEVFRISNLKRFPKIKHFIKKHFVSLLEVFPIWISRPEDVSDIIKCEEKIFDYGIFDEASQMFLERSYPTLYRTNIKIVAGDDKQLKPSSFFTSRYEEDEEEDEQEEENLEYKIKNSDFDSLLSRSIVSNWNEILLNNHYRSISQELIEFSNKNIYNNALNVASYNKDLGTKAFEVINVNGYFVNRENIKEADKVLEIVLENLLKYPKILIITFNESQANLITSKILLSKNKEAVLRVRNSKLVITNLENVQGNEGDLVILSIGYGKSSHDQKMKNFFGPLNMDGGRNRLNVGITRAKEKMIVIKSFSGRDMSVSKTNLNAQLFKDFIVHCDNSVANISVEKSFLPLKNSFEINVFDNLEKYILEINGLILIPKYKIGTKRIDLVIFNTKDNKVLLGIEFHKWEDNNHNVFEEFDKQLFIEKRGYKVFNIFEVEWRKNKQRIIEKILVLINKK